MFGDNERHRRVDRVHSYGVRHPTDMNFWTDCLDLYMLLYSSTSRELVMHHYDDQLFDYNVQSTYENTMVMQRDKAVQAT